jgi:hypothetical protein
MPFVISWNPRMIAYASQNALLASTLVPSSTSSRTVASTIRTAIAR